MAGDWIKMRVDLQSHPKVVRILSATGTDKFRTIGGLHAVWTVFDTHSIDGALKGYTPGLLDHVIGWEGFSKAMESVGWLEFDGLETLTLPEFTEHNGQSAKRRAEDQKRKRDTRKPCPQSVRKMSADLRTRERGREEVKAPVVPKGDDSAAVLSAYHAALPKCQRIAVLNPKRKRRIADAVKLARQVCAGQGWDYVAGEFWPAYFGECAADPWLRGDRPNPNNPRWVQNLDVLLAEDRFAEIMDKAVAAMRGAA